MKYRIIQKKYSNGKKYYIAQYMQGGEWLTLEVSGIFGAVPEHFSSKKSTIKALEKKAQERKNETYIKVVEEDVL